MKRIVKKPVRGISLKLQEEEREARLDFIPEVRMLQPMSGNPCLFVRLLNQLLTCIAFATEIRFGAGGDQDRS